MNDALQLLGVLLAVVCAGTIGYAAFMLVTSLGRRLKRNDNPALPAEELEAIRERLAEADQLEARVTELEERMDFTERMLAQQRDAERLSSGQPVEPQH